MPYQTDSLLLETLEDVAAFYRVDVEELMELNKMKKGTAIKEKVKKRSLIIPFDTATGTPYQQRCEDHICNCEDPYDGEAWVRCEQCSGWCHVDCIESIDYGRPHYKKSNKNKKCKTLDDFENDAQPWFCPNCDLIRRNLCMAKGSNVPRDKAKYVLWLKQQHATDHKSSAGKSKRKSKGGSNSNESSKGKGKGKRKGKGKGKGLERGKQNADAVDAADAAAATGGFAGPAVSKEDDPFDALRTEFKACLASLDLLGKKCKAKEKVIEKAHNVARAELEVLKKKLAAVQEDRKRSTKEKVKSNDLKGAVLRILQQEIEPDSLAIAAAAAWNGVKDDLAGFDFQQLHHNGFEQGLKAALLKVEGVDMSFEEANTEG